MARPLDEIVRLDRRWFRAHPETRYHCRALDTGELASCENNRVALLVVTSGVAASSLREQTRPQRISRPLGAPWKTTG
jgi:hypothetical protein